MSSLISWFVKSEGLPIFDNVVFATGCEQFLFRAKDEKECWNLYYDFLATVPNNKVVKAYRIGLRPDYPVPVAKYFIEVVVDDPLDNGINLWTVVERGRLAV